MILEHCIEYYKGSVRSTDLGSTILKLVLVNLSL